MLYAILGIILIGLSIAFVIETVRSVRKKDKEINNNKEVK